MLTRYTFVRQKYTPKRERERERAKYLAHDRKRIGILGINDELEQERPQYRLHMRDGGRGETQNVVAHVAQLARRYIDLLLGLLSLSS